MKRFTLSELEAMPTISQAQDSDLKVDLWNGQLGTGTRVWLLRDPDQPMVTVEEYIDSAEGARWVESERYVPENDTDAEDDEQLVYRVWAQGHNQAWFPVSMEFNTPEDAEEWAARLALEHRVEAEDAE